MATCPTLCLLASITVFVVSATNERILDHHDNYIEKMNILQSNFRWSRSFVGFGNAAIKAVLRGTKEVPTRSKTYRKFVKQGGPQTARDDLYRMNPTLLKHNKWHAKAVLDDGTFVKMEVYDKTNGRLPTLFIEDRTKANPIKIVYIDKPFSGVMKY